LKKSLTVPASRPVHVAIGKGCAGIAIISSNGLIISACFALIKALFIS